MYRTVLPASQPWTDIHADSSLSDQVWPTITWSTVAASRVASAIPAEAKRVRVKAWNVGGGTAVSSSMRVLFSSGCASTAWTVFTTAAVVWPPL